MAFWRDLGIQLIVCGIILSGFVHLDQVQPTADPSPWTPGLVVAAWAAMTVWTAAVGHSLVVLVLGRQGWLWTWAATVLALPVYYLVPAVVAGNSLTDLVEIFVFVMMFFCLPWGTAIFAARGLIELLLIRRARGQQGQAMLENRHS